MADTMKARIRRKLANEFVETGKHPEVIVLPRAEFAALHEELVDDGSVIYDSRWSVPEGNERPEFLGYVLMMNGPHCGVTIEPEGFRKGQAQTMRVS